jgi:hypothetical protein
MILKNSGMPAPPRREKVSYKLYEGAVSHRFSPRAGLLAVARVYRSLGLPEVMGNNLKPNGSGGDSQSVARRADRRLASNLVESLLLLQASGADCVQDCALLADDPCLMTGLGYMSPSSAEAESFLRWLGRNELNAQGCTQFHDVMMHMVNGIWDAYGQDQDFERAKQITLDVIAMPVGHSPHVSWCSPTAPNAFPCRVVCLWREADLVLSGGVCANANALIRPISEGLATIPAMASRGRLIRAGSLCYEPAVLSWLANQKTAYRVKTRSGKIQNRSTHTRFIVAAPLTSNMLAALDQSRSGWSAAGVQSSFSVAWKTYVPENQPSLPHGVRHVALRNPQASQEIKKYIYAAVATNGERLEGHVVNWFLRDAKNVNQIVGDIELLASGSNPGVLSELTGEGRFQLALINYNLCAAIRHLGFSGDKGNIPINRLRELLFHATGRMAKTERVRSLKISQPNSKEVFSKLRRRFPLAERART